MISLQEAQQLLASLPEAFAEASPALIITNNDQPVLSILPYEVHQALLEHLAALQTSLAILSGQAIGVVRKPKQERAPCAHPLSWEEFQKEVGWDEL